MPKRLLVVDDSHTIREAARLALAGEDWTVIAAGTPDEALELLWGETPAAILCDADLGGAGIELCRKIRGQPGGRDIPLLLTGAAATEAAAAAAGATATLATPFGAEELEGALQAALDAQSFSLDLDTLGPAGDAPLSLEELDGPFPFPTPAAPPPEERDVEIIDLSGDEEYEELELIEDLEPLGTAADSYAGEPFSLGVDDLLSAPAAVRAPPPAPSDEIDLDALFATAPPEGAAVRESRAGTAPAADLDRFGETFPEEAPFEFIPPPPPASADIEVLRAESPSAYVEGPSSYGLPPKAPTAEAAPPHEGALPPGTEDTVRAALAHTLSLEALTPTVERIVERVVWEVVPRLAERLIREAIEKLRTEPPEG
ncbi:MAG: response regulator [Deltaproteobacteria bacterium]|nr:response regulator [Deltaproteobacteria bacterium]